MEPSIKVNMNYLKNLPRGTHSDQEIDTKDKTVNPVPMEKFIEPILKRVGLPPEKITEFDLMELQKTEKRQESHSPNDVITLLTMQPKIEKDCGTPPNELKVVYDTFNLEKCDLTKEETRKLANLLIPKKINQKFSTQLLSNVKLKQHVKDQSKAKLIKQHQLRILSSKNI